MINYELECSFVMLQVDVVVESKVDDFVKRYSNNQNPFIHISFSESITSKLYHFWFISISFYFELIEIVPKRASRRM